MAADDTATIFALKGVPFRGRHVQIVCQADNGPCPLLAVCNALLLRGALTLPPSGGDEWVGGDSLAAALRSQLLAASGAAATADANAQAVLCEALAQVRGLVRGLDVNVRFSDVEGFESTPQLSVFDAAGVRLLHGWVYGPHEPAACALGSVTYNQAVELAIGEAPPTAALPATVAQQQPDLLTFAPINEDTGTFAPVGGDEGTWQPAPEPAGAAATAAPPVSQQQLQQPQQRQQLIRRWLEDTRGQLTHAGLAGLAGRLLPGELAVLYRNGHFSTVVLHEGRVHVLVTDVGYQHAAHVVWERVDDCSNDTTLCDGAFAPIVAAPPSGWGARAAPDDATPPQRYTVAMPQHAHDASAAVGGPQAWSSAGTMAAGRGGTLDSDHELALRLQQEEERLAVWANAASVSALPSTTHPHASHHGSSGHPWPPPAEHARGVGGGEPSSAGGWAPAGARVPAAPPAAAPLLVGRNDRYAAQAAGLRAAAAEREARRRGAGGGGADGPTSGGGSSSARGAPPPGGPGGDSSSPSWQQPRFVGTGPPGGFASAPNDWERSPDARPRGGGGGSGCIIM